MKIRIILSVIVAFAYEFAKNTYSFLYSPIAGVATANSVNEGVGDYATAKFIREGGVQSLMWDVTLLLLVLIWIYPVINWVKTGKFGGQKQ